MRFTAQHKQHNPLPYQNQVDREDIAQDVEKNGGVGGALNDATGVDNSDSIDGISHTAPDDATKMIEEDNNTESGAIFRFQCAVKQFLSRPPVEYTILSLIVINSIMLGIGTFDFITENEQARVSFDIIDFIFLIVFTVEVAFRFFSEGKSFYTDFWLLFDLFLIATSWVAMSGDTNLHALRGLRVLRILAKIEIFRAIVGAVSKMIPKLASLFVIVLIIIFIFAILFTTLFGEISRNNELDANYFGRFDYTLLSLYQLMTLDAWIDVTRDVMKQKPWAWTLFLTYVILTSYMMTNLLIATICESTSYLQTQDQEVMDKNSAIDKEMMKIQLSLTNMHQDMCVKLGLDSRESERKSLFYLTEEESFVSKTVADSTHITLRETMRDTLRNNTSNTEDITKPTGPLAEFRFKCGLFINNEYIQLVIMGLIFSNSVLDVVETYNFTDDGGKDENLEDVFGYIQKAFLVIFTIEIILQFIYHGWKFFTIGWNVFDLVIVVTSWALSQFAAFRVFRVFRIVRLFPKLKPLREVCDTMVKSVKGLGALLCMLLIFFYTFAVVFTTLFKNDDLSPGYEGYFNRLDETFLTLFQIMTMVNWGPISRELRDHVSWAPLLTSAFLTLTGLLFINLMIALICESQQKIKEEKTKDLRKSSMMLEASIENRLEKIKTLEENIQDLLETCDIRLKSE